MKKILEMIKNWYKKTALPFLKIYWLQIINIIVIFIGYSTVNKAEIYPITESILGVWIFILMVYYIFWKLLGFEKAFKK